MNENLNLVEIFKNIQKGTVFFSPLFGDITFVHLYSTGEYPIQLRDSSGIVRTFDKYGRNSYLNVECLLFPSKDQRDWSKFELPLKDKELVWCWDIAHIFCRRLGFYDAKNNCTFYPDTGRRGGYRYDKYERFKGEWPEWAKEAVKNWRTETENINDEENLHTH